MQLVAKGLCLLLGGGLGALARFGVAELFRTRTRFPGWVAMLLVNVTGSFLIGLGFGLLGEPLPELQLHPPPSGALVAGELRGELLFALGVTGFCGGYTTFSAYSLDAVLLLQQGRWGEAFINLFLPIVLGSLALVSGLGVAGASG